MTNSFIINFCDEMSQLLNTGISPISSIEILLEDETDKESIHILKRIKDLMDEGHNFSESVELMHSFPKYMVSMLKIAEKVGKLDVILAELKKYYERIERIKSELVNALTVPILLFFILIAIFVVLVVKILPIFNNIFSQLGIEMGEMARDMLSLGQILSEFSSILTAILSCVVITLLLFLIIPFLRKRLIGLFMNASNKTGFIYKLCLSHFMSSMSMYLYNGYTVENAIIYSSTFFNDMKSIKKVLDKVIKEVQEGKYFISVFKDNALLTSKDIIKLKVAEKTGRIDNAFEVLSEKYETEAYNEIDRIVESIEPIIVVLMGLIVSTVILSVLMPLLGLLSSML